MDHTKTTTTTKLAIKRAWHLIDLKGQTLGRVSTLMAELLLGKGKTYFTPNLDCSDYIVAINAGQIVVTGNKETKKIYRHHTGYPGGFREFDLNHMMASDPREVIRIAVAGMLPKNRLRDVRLSHLKIFVDDQHSYAHKFKSETK